MTAPTRLRLDTAVRAAWSERYEHTRGAVERTNCQIVLLADEGRHAPEIAWLVRRECIKCARCRIGFKPKAWPGPAPRAWTALLITPLGCRSLRPA